MFTKSSISVSLSAWKIYYCCILESYTYTLRQAVFEVGETGIVILPDFRIEPDTGFSFYVSKIGELNACRISIVEWARGHCGRVLKVKLLRQEHCNSVQTRKFSYKKRDCRGIGHFSKVRRWLNAKVYLHVRFTLFEFYPRNFCLYFDELRSK